jgi:hypothetical protein
VAYGKGEKMSEEESPLKKFDTGMLVLVLNALGVAAAGAVVGWFFSLPILALFTIFGVGIIVWFYLGEKAGPHNGTSGGIAVLIFMVVIAIFIVFLWVGTFWARIATFAGLHTSLASLCGAVTEFLFR